MNLTGIKVEGARELSRTFRQIDKDLPRELRPIHRDTTTPVAALAEQLAPHRSGRLAGTVRVLASQRRGQVAAGRATVPYAGPIHWGWPLRNIAEQPFLTEALGRKQNEVVDIYMRGIDRLIDRVWATAPR